MLKLNEVYKTIELSTPRSAWNKGVKTYALDLLEDLETTYKFTDLKKLNEDLLNGAKDWYAYSWVGCSLIYDGDIAERVSNATELKRTKNGERQPNKNEQWLDVQARALYQACRLIKRTIKTMNVNETQ